MTRPKQRPQRHRTLKAQVKAIMSQESEKKYHDQNSSVAFSANDYASVHLTPIPAGETEHERLGVDVKLRRLQLKLLAHVDAATSDTFRVTVFSWTGTVSPGEDDIFSGTYITDPIDGEYFDGRRGYIYYDKVFHLDAATNPSKVIDLNIPLKNKTCSFTGTLGSNIAKNQLYCFVKVPAVKATSSYILGSRCWFIE